MSRPRFVRFSSLLVLLALVLAACGDDDTSTATADGGSDAGQEEAERIAEDAIAGELGGECGFLGEFAGGFEDAVDPGAAFGEDAGGAYDRLAEQFAEVADAAPGEIQDAFRTLADGMSAAAEAFAGVDFSDPESIDPEAFAELEETFGPEFEQASDDIEAWVTENCDIPS